MSVALPVRTRRLGSHLEPVIRREADAPSAAQRIIEKLVEPMLNVELRIDPREITHRVCGLAGLGRIIRITRAASEADVLAHLRFEKDPGVPLLRIAECCVRSADTAKCAIGVRVRAVRRCKRLFN